MVGIGRPEARAHRISSGIAKGSRRGAVGSGPSKSVVLPDQRQVPVGERLDQLSRPLVFVAGAPHSNPPFPAVRAPITVVIVDANLLVAESLSVLLDANSDLTVVAIAGTCAAGLDAVALHQPEVVVLHQQLPDGMGTDILHKLFDACPAIKALIVSADDRDDVLLRALRAGAAGVVRKTDRGAALVVAVRSVAHNEAIITPDALRGIRRHLSQRTTGPNDELTAREHEVLALLVKGKNTRAVADALTIASTTARNHIQSIMRKRGVHSRLEVVAMALRENIRAP
jgi:DNA-binding NarL/FixJ family response regulator